MQLRKALFFILTGLVCMYFNSQAQITVDGRGPLAQLSAIDKLVKEEMDKQHISGLSLGIVKNGKTMLVKGYGSANLEHSIPATENTVYKIGSVSKQMIATAIMLLIEQKKLRLTDSLPAFFKRAPASWNKITIRHLLNHTSGLPRDSPVLDNMKEQADSVLIKGAYGSKLLFEPGSGWRYCNLGYFMLADIIRQLSGQSFPTFMQENIFNKHGLNATRTTSVSAIIKNRADGYVYKAPDNIYQAKDYVALRPSGAFVSSVNDLVKWETLIQSGKIITTESWESMWADIVRTSAADQNPAEYYGYGWDVNNYKGRRIVHHDGTLPGFTSSYFRFIDSDSAIIILTNADNAYPKSIALGIADLLFR